VTPLSHDDIQELLGAYALHAVDADEAEVVERHLDECPRCRAEVAGHRDVAARLGNTGGLAPEGLWDRIASHLEEVPPPMRLHLPDAAGTVIPLAPRRRAVVSRVAAVALSAAAVLAIGVLGAQVVRQQDRLDRFEAALSDGSALDPNASQAALESPDGDVTGSAVLLTNGTGYLMVDDLPALDGDRTYQLWGLTDAGLISLGLLGSEPGAIVPFQAGDGIDALAITAEASGGVVQSDNPAVVAGEFD
jgi:anti-sigma factor RsiW